MLPIHDLDASQPHADDLDQFPADLPADALHATLDGIDLAVYRAAVPGAHFADLNAPTTWVRRRRRQRHGRDRARAPVAEHRQGAHRPGLALSGKRLVYGGHTIGIAAAQLTKALPNLVTIIGWHHCNHLAPVFEGDVLRSTVHLEGTEALPDGGGLVTLRIEVAAQRADGALDGGTGLATRGSDGMSDGILSGDPRDRGLGVRRRADGGHDARPARRRRHPLRRPGRRPGLEALAADLRRRQPLLVGPAEGQALDRVDLRSDEGREQLSQLITTPGDGNGIFMTNFPARGWMSYEKLSERRADLIMVVMTGNHDGSSEVDYTVNPSVGFPEAMGPRDSAVPTNSLMPAWDTAMGGLAVVGLLAALRHRDKTGEGQLVTIALSDVAFATVGNLGRIAEVQLEGREQPRDGNYLYGAFGGDFPTSDGRRVMVVGLTGRQWKALKEATGTEELFDTVAQATGHDLRGEAGPLQGPRPHPRAADAVVRRAHARGDPRRRSPAPASRGAPTRPSSSSSRRTRAARRPTRCSPRSSTRSARTSRPPRRSSSRCTAACRRCARRASASTPTRSSPSSSARRIRPRPRPAQRPLHRSRAARRARNVPTQSGLHQWPVRRGTSSLRVAVGSQDSSVVSD